MEQLNKFLKLPQVLKQLGVGKTKLWNMVRKGEFPSVGKKGGEYGICKGEVL